MFDIHRIKQASLYLDYTVYHMNVIPAFLFYPILRMYRPTLLGSVRMEYNHNCTIQLGACCTSVYLEHNTSCIVYSTAHQLRIHGCRDCKLYVKVGSSSLYCQHSLQLILLHYLTYIQLERHCSTHTMTSLHSSSSIVILAMIV